MPQTATSVFASESTDCTNCPTFGQHSLPQIMQWLTDELHAKGKACYLVPDPDSGLGLYAGEQTDKGIHRPWQLWLDVAEIVGAHFLTPQPQAGGWVCLRWQALAKSAAPDATGYQPTGQWGRVHKLEDPHLLQSLLEALRRVNPPNGGRVLALGLNAGHELAALDLAFPERDFEIVGLDICPEALAQAAHNYPAANLLLADVNELPAELGHFDTVLTLSLLQSPQVVADLLISRLHKRHLRPTGGLIIGLPNARYRDGQLCYGARLKNFARPDLSLLMNDVTQLRRRLQRFGYKTFVTGKYEVLLTAIPAKQPTPSLSQRYY